MKICTHAVRRLCLTVLVLIGALPLFSQQIQKHLTISTGESIGFLEYKPRDYAKTTTKYPIIIFLHGIGERGTGIGADLDRVACCGLPRVIKWGHTMTFTWNGKTETFLVLSPQCPSKYGMWPEVLVDDLIKYAKDSLRIDQDRIFLTGLSMGAGGTYKYISGAQKWADNIAAAAAISPPCVFNKADYMVKNNMPFWGWHAADDNIVPYTCTEAAVKKINALNPKVKPLKTIWPTGGHVVWDRVYTDTNYVFDGAVNVYEWFLGQGRRGGPVNVLPIAKTAGNIGASTSSGIANLDASASTDADGKIVRYVWKKIAGPNAGYITTAFGTSPSTTVSGLTIAGTYQFQLTVVDDRASFARDTLTVNVASGASIPNQVPVAKITGPASITLPTSAVTLSAGSSTDADGSVVSYSWNKETGGNAFINSPSAATTNITALAEGTYSFRVTITDNKGATSTTKYTVVVNAAAVVVNKLPVAKTSGNATITLPTSSVSLNGSSSTDEDGTIASYAWSKVSGGNAVIAAPTAASTAVSGLSEGTYSFKLIVTDNKGGKSETQVTVTVNPAPVVPNKLPVAKASGNATITLPTSSVSVNGSSSTDEDGTIASYAWSKVSGGNAVIAAPTAASTAITGLAEGTYTFKLIVTDNRGGKSETQMTVTVNPAPVIPNKLPIANAGVDLSINLASTSQVTLNGGVSYDPDGTIKSVSWTKIDGPSSGTIENPNAVVTKVTGLAGGVYTFAITVTDNKDAVSTDQVVITVFAPVVTKPIENALPIANAGADATTNTDFPRVLLRGQESKDTDGWISSFYWSQLSGPNSANIETATKSNTNITGLVQGVYVFRFTVFDNKGDSAYDDATVTVNGINNQAPIAEAGRDTTITTAYPHILLSGLGSRDTDGYLASLEWRKVSGPASCDIEKCNSITTHANNLQEGTYVFRLTVKDNRGDSTSDDVKIVVDRFGTIKGNAAPIANAGTDIQTTVDYPRVLIKGHLSKDNDGWIDSLAWSQVSGPAGAIVEDTKHADTYLSGLVEGVYVYRFTVIDNKGASASDDVVITVKASNRIAPVANAGDDKTATVAYPNVLLTGYKSKDADGYLVSVNWEKVSGPEGDVMATPNGVNTYVSGLKEGVYVYRVTVKDNSGLMNSDDVIVTVTNPYAAVASASKLEPVIEEGLTAYPNPASSSVMMNYSSAAKGKSLVTFYDAYGKPARSVAFEKTQIVQQVPVNLTDLAHGLYHVIITTGSTKMQTTIVKQ